MIPRRQRRLVAFCFLLLQSPDVRLEIHTQNQQKSFYIGQVIPIELRFSSATPGTYQLDMANYDRSGRMSIEEFSVASAAAYLQKLGAASAEDALWDRFSRWSAQWKDRAGELRYMPGTDLSKVHQAGAGQNVLSALAEGHAWLVDQTKLLRLIELSVGPDERRRAEEYLRRWEQKPWTITFRPGDPPGIGIVHYDESSTESAKIKLSQFPAGTRLQWIRNGRRSEQEERALKELSAFALTLGIVIEPTPLR